MQPTCTLKETRSEARRCSGVLAPSRLTHELRLFNHHNLTSWIWVVTLTLSVQPVLTLAATPPTNSPAPLESFKSFLAAPPRIEELLWKKAFGGNISGRFPAQGASARTTRGGWFLARWQPGYLYLKSGADSTVSDPIRKPGERVNSRVGSDFWTVEPLGMTTHWRDPAPAAAEVTMQPSRAFHHRAEEFNQVMNMGLMHLEAGTVRWNGNNLSATGYIQEIKSPVRVTGAVEPDDNGTGLGADYSYGSPTQSAGAQTGFFHVGRAADVRLRETGGQVQLEIDGVPVAGTGARLTSEFGLACIPRLLRPRASRVLVVGFGSGAASGQSLLFPGTKVVCAEPEPAAVAAAMMMQNLVPPSIPSISFSLVPKDGRASLLSRSNAYDLLLVNFGDPHIPETQKTWTKQFYTSAKLALSPDGLIAQRFAISAVSTPELALLSRTLLGVFPHCALFHSSVSEILLVGSSAPLIESTNAVGEAQALVAGLPDIKSALGQHFGTTDVPSLLLTQFWLDEEGLRAVANSDGESALLTDWNRRFRLRPVHSNAQEKTERELLLRNLITGSTTPAAFERWARTCGCPSSEAAAACHRIAEQFLVSGQPKQALEVLTWGLGLDTGQPDLLADRLIWTKEEDIEIIVRDVAVVEKRSVAAANRVGVSLFQRALNRQAAAVLAGLTRIKPESATLWADLAVVYRATGELKRAEACLSQALALDPLNEFVQHVRVENHPHSL
jgi:hypothetical protein